MNVYDMDIYVYRYKHLTSINRKNNCEETQSEHVHFEKYVTCPMHTMHSLHMYTYIWIDTNTCIYINEYIYIYLYSHKYIFQTYVYLFTYLRLDQQRAVEGPTGIPDLGHDVPVPEAPNKNGWLMGLTDSCWIG